MDNPSQCLNTLPVKIVRLPACLNLPSSNLKPFPFVLSLKSLSPSSYSPLLFLRQTQLWKHWAADVSAVPQAFVANTLCFGLLGFSDSSRNKGMWPSSPGEEQSPASRQTPALPLVPPLFDLQRAGSGLHYADSSHPVFEQANSAINSLR